MRSTELKLTAKHHQIIGLCRRDANAGLPRSHFHGNAYDRLRAKELLWEDLVYWVKDRDGKLRLLRRRG